ncbi:hypothetical protein [Lacinutrix salivirga]
MKNIKRLFLLITLIIVTITVLSSDFDLSLDNGMFGTEIVNN